MSNYKLGFIGAGKLAGSVIRGLIRAKFCAPGEIVASEPNEQTRTALRNETEINLTTKNAEVAEKAQTILTGVKPPMVLPVLRELSDVVTSLSGSGPAFVYTVIEALADGGTRMGLASEVAMELAIQTVRGAAEIMRKSKMSPEELRKMVVTPGGTTAAGLAVMEKLGTGESLVAAVEAAAKRGQEMAKENS